MSATKMKLKKGDSIVVRSGSLKGKTGKISAVLPKTNQIVVEGVNVHKKHLKPSQTNPQGGIQEVTHPINVSKVGIAHPSGKGKTSRVGTETNAKGNKTRVYRQAGNKEIK